jgi:hypothetical protein
MNFLNDLKAFTLDELSNNEQLKPLVGHVSRLQHLAGQANHVVSVVNAGMVKAGKSTLFNALVE